jgi:cobalt/nickel transport system permease protein
MGIGGPLAGYAVYKTLKNTSISIYITVFLTCAIADMTTYVITSTQLALAYPAEIGGILASFSLFLAIFAVTQIPLAIVEGCVLTLAFKYIIQLKPEMLIKLKVFSEEQIQKASAGVSS